MFHARLVSVFELQLQGLRGMAQVVECKRGILKSQSFPQIMDTGKDRSGEWHRHPLFAGHRPICGHFFRAGPHQSHGAYPSTVQAWCKVLCASGQRAAGSFYHGEIYIFMKYNVQE
jgi:hypothetical protein